MKLYFRVTCHSLTTFSAVGDLKTIIQVMSHFFASDLITCCIFHQTRLIAAANQIKLSDDAQGEFE